MMSVCSSFKEGSPVDKDLHFFHVLLTVHPSIFILVINQIDAQNFCFTISLFHASTCFQHHVFIIRWSKLYYTASGIITLSKKVVFIQLLRLCGVHLLYINC